MPLPPVPSQATSGRLVMASREVHDELYEAVQALFDRLKPDLVAIRKGLWVLLVRPVHCCLVYTVC